MSSYNTPRALEMAIKEAAKASPQDTNRAIQGFYFHRFLCRIFSDAGSSFILKGGLSMLARTINARSTRDIDLTTSTLDIESAIEELKTLASINLDDYVNFTYVSCVPIKVEDEYRDGYSVTFDAYLGAKKMQSISIDLVSDAIVCDDFEKLTPVDRVDVKGLPVYDYRIYPATRSVADKVCGIIERHNGNPSSRVKDLVDIAVFAHTINFDAAALAQTITREFTARKIAAPSAFNVPSEWKNTQEARYEKMLNNIAIGQIAATMHDAEVLAQAFLNPILDGSMAVGTWSCVDKEWRR